MTDPTLVGILYFLLSTSLGLLAWLAKAIFSGDLVPKKSIEFAAQNWKDQLEEKNNEAAEWRSLYEAERAIGVTSRENRDILLAVSKTMDKVLSALPTAADATVGG